MSVEDPLEEEKREKPTPRTTPLYYLLAFVFTLTIGTASFLAGKWSVESPGLEAGANSFELYTASSSGGLHRGGSSATNATTTTVTIPPPPQLPTSATTEAATAHSSPTPTAADIVEVTETAEWIFAEILSTTAFAGKPSTQIPTTGTETTSENGTEETVTGSTPGDGTLRTTSETTETTTENVSTTSNRFDTTIASTTTEDPPGAETGTAEVDNAWTSASQLFVETRSPPVLSTTEDPEDRSGTTVTTTSVVSDPSETARTTTEGPESTAESTTLPAAETTTPSPTTTTDDPAAVTTDCPPEVEEYSATTEDWTTTGWPVAPWPRPLPEVMRIWPPRNRYRDRQMWKKMREARREMNDMLKLFNRFLHDTDDLFD